MNCLPFGVGFLPHLSYLLTSLGGGGERDQPYSIKFVSRYMCFTGGHREHLSPLERKVSIAPTKPVQGILPHLFFGENQFHRSEKK